MISLQPGTYAVKKLLRFPVQDIETQAIDRWTVSPATTYAVRPARMLPGQLDRIRGTEFGTAEDVVRDCTGGFDSVQQATIGYRLKDVTLIDGVLYAKKAVRHLRPRSGFLPARLRPPTIDRAAMYESWPGNRWFGNWLYDDCLTYRLAEAEGLPVTSASPHGHKAAYEQGLDMRPARVDAAHFEELILFADSSHNAGKSERAADLRARLVKKNSAPPHPGVFLIRSDHGARRVLVNEMAIAEHLAVRRGFTVLDPVNADLDETIRVCGGAQVVAGVEGSQLVHGLMLMPPEARALVIQPPTRVVSVLKLLTDRQDQDFGLVIGTGDGDFTADVGEIERTLDLA